MSQPTKKVHRNEIKKWFRGSKLTLSTQEKYLDICLSVSLDEFFFLIEHNHFWSSRNNICINQYPFNSCGGAVVEEKNMYGMDHVVVHCGIIYRWKTSSLLVVFTISIPAYSEATFGWRLPPLLLPGSKKCVRSRPLITQPTFSFHYCAHHKLKVTKGRIVILDNNGVDVCVTMYPIF